MAIVFGARETAYEKLDETRTAKRLGADRRWATARSHS
jgi:hypothetical protein